MSRRNKKSIPEKNSKKDTVAFIVKVISIILCLASFIYVIRHYHNFVIVKFEFLLYIYLIAGVLFGLLFYKYQKNYEGKNFKSGNYFALILLVYGTISCATFFLANEYLSTNTEYVVVSPILEKHESHKRSPNSILVQIEGTKKEINIHNYDFKEISMYNFAEIKIKRGYWNFPIILETKLLVSK
ncbi:hypothetical protein [Flavobacterium sp. SLB02]|jgi:hypothetical protein|uniref:hypothetical protein n=1 Tax=Flavobacterium sp. SLB02 TaxID=2665645 RepID=UPI0012A8E80C|nr:hypothetical protein [Flavobacterium sp. SLB02]QGK72963.1 hypothetical protein GIY83_02420 [Flavobacterium sp. SLB02]